MFTDLYLSTTDPSLTLSQMLSRNAGPILVSVLFHTVVYMLSANLAYYIFRGKGVLLPAATNQRLCAALVVIMALGYVARFYHVHEIYASYHGNMEKTRKHLDSLYISWTFIG